MARLTVNQRRALVNEIVTNCGCKNERQVFNALSDKALYTLYRQQVRNEGADMGEEDMYWEANNNPTANEDEYELDAAGNPILDESGNPKRKAAMNEGEEFPEEEFAENEGEFGEEEIPMENEEGEFPAEEFAENEGEEEEEFLENTEGVMGSGADSLMAGQEGLSNPPSANRRVGNRRGRVGNGRRHVANAAQQEEAYLRSAPPRIREMLNNAMAFDQQRKNECIRIITANSNNMFTKEFLRTKTLKELRALANLANNGAVHNSAPSMLLPTYAGSGPVSPTANAGGFNPNDDLLPLPVTNFAARPVKKRRRG